MSYKFTIVIPIYNEEDNINRLGKELLSFINKSNVKTKVLFINDGSTDKSLQHIESLCDNTRVFNYISFDKNYGLSAALKAGFQNTDTNLVGYMDADLQTSPEDFNLLFEYIDTYDLVTGVRVTRNDGLLKKISSKIANKFRRLFTKDGIYDTGCPLKIIKTSYAKQIPMFKGLHRFLPAMILLQGGTIKQVPVRHFQRLSGSSKFGLRNRLVGPLTDCIAFLWMKSNYINYNINKRNTKS